MLCTLHHLMGLPAAGYMKDCWSRQRLWAISHGSFSRGTLTPHSQEQNIRISNAFVHTAKTSANHLSTECEVPFTQWK